MAQDDYADLRRAAQAWMKIAATPQYQQMVRAAQAKATEDARQRVQEQARLAAEPARQRILREAARSVEAQRRISREAIRDAQRAADTAAKIRLEAAKQASLQHQIALAAAALQPVLDQYIKASSTWVAAAQRAFANPTLLTVIRTWSQLAIAAEGERLADAVTEPTAIADLQEIADSAELGDADLDSFAAEIAEIPDLDELLEAAADGLVADHPYISRERARKLVVALAYVAWLATLVGLSVGAAPIFAVLAALAGGVGWDAEKVSSVAGKTVDALPKRLFGEHDDPHELPDPHGSSTENGPDSDEGTSDESPPN